MAAHLPGQSVGVKDDEWGMFCYTHHDREATHRICTESDSFGSEYMNLCAECWDEHQAYKEKVKGDESLWETCKCGNREPKLISYRDMDEGMHGPVYEHCSKCHERMNARIAEEYAYYHDDDDDWFDDSHHDDGTYDDPRDDYNPPRLVPTTQEIIDFVLKTMHGCGFNGFRIEAGDGVIKGLIMDNLDIRAYKRAMAKLENWLWDNTEQCVLDDKWTRGATGVNPFDIIELCIETHVTDRVSIARRNKKPMVFNRLKGLSNKLKLGEFKTPKGTIRLKVELYHD